MERLFRGEKIYYIVTNKEKDDIRTSYVYEWC